MRRQPTYPVGKATGHLTGCCAVTCKTCPFIRQRELLAVGYRIQPQKGWHMRQITDRPQITGGIFKTNGQLVPSKRLHRSINLLRV